MLLYVLLLNFLFHYNNSGNDMVKITITFSIFVALEKSIFTNIITLS